MPLTSDFTAATRVFKNNPEVTMLPLPLPLSAGARQ